MPIIPIPKSKTSLNNNYNITIGDNSHISAIASENVTDNSTSSFTALTPELFNQVRLLIDKTNSDYKNMLIEFLAKIEQTKNAGDKKECGNWFGKFFSLVSIADCITLTQPLVPLISWLCE